MENFDNRYNRYKSIPAHNGNIVSIALSPNETFFVTGSWDKTAKTWSFPEGNLLKTLEGHTAYVMAVAINPGNSLIATGGSDSIICLWDYPTGEKLFEWDSHVTVANGIQFTPSGTKLFSQSRGGEIMVIDFFNETIYREIIHKWLIEQAILTFDERLLITASRDKTIKVSDFGTLEILETLTQHRDEVKCIALNKSEKYLASGSADGIIHIYDTTNWNLHTTIELNKKGFVSKYFWRTGVVQLVFDNFNRLICGGNNGEISVFDIHTGSLIIKVQAHPSLSLDILRLIPDTDLIASAGQDKVIKIWNLHDLPLIQSLPGHTDAINQVVFDQRGKYMITASKDKTIGIWRKEI